MIGAKAAALTPDVDLSTPLRATTTAIKATLGPEADDDSRSGPPRNRTASTPVASTARVTSPSMLLGVIALPLRTAQGLYAIAGAVLRMPARADAAGELHPELVGLRADLSGLPADSRRLADDVDQLLPKIDELSGQLDQMRTELAEQVQGLRTDLSGLPFVRNAPKEPPASAPTSQTSRGARRARSW